MLYRFSLISRRYVLRLNRFSAHTPFEGSHVLLPNMCGLGSLPVFLKSSMAFFRSSKARPLVARASLCLRNTAIPGDCLSIATSLFPRNTFSHFLCHSLCFKVAPGLFLFAVVDEKIVASGCFS